MLKKNLIIMYVSTFLLFVKPNIALGGVDVVSPSATIAKERSESSDNFDFRVKTLKGFFEKYNSPLTEYSDTFVSSADEYGLDWRLVPAITGVESTFGKRIPANSYNAYGWANGNYTFESWPDSIEHVSKTLREKYIDNNATTIGQIARRYAPPSTTWGWKVKFFMNKIDSTPVSYDL